MLIKRNIADTDLTAYEALFWINLLRVCSWSKLRKANTYKTLGAQQFKEVETVIFITTGRYIYMYLYVILKCGLKK